MGQKWTNVNNYIKPSSGHAVSGHKRKVQTHKNENGQNRRKKRFLVKPPVDETHFDSRQIDYLKEKNLQCVSFDGADYSGAAFDAKRVTRCTFQGANLEKVSFGAGPKGAKLEIVEFKNANLKGASFNNTWFNDVSFEGADLTDVNFSQVWISSTGPVVLSGAKITGDTFDDLAFGGAPPFDPSNTFQYRRLHPLEVAKNLGIDEDEMRLLLWAGDIEVRDSYSLRRVSQTYDAEKHHIPEWVLYQQ